MQHEYLEKCARCNGEGWLPPSEIYSDGSYSTSRECPRCRGACVTEKHVHVYDRGMVWESSHCLDCGEQKPLSSSEGRSNG
jgi:DnaJ-class molecular chaperone